MFINAIFHVTSSDLHFTTFPTTLEIYTRLKKLKEYTDAFKIQN